MFLSGLLAALVMAGPASAVKPHGPGAGAAGGTIAPGVGTLYFGEGGGGPPPSPEAGDFLEHNPRQVAGDGTFGRLEPERGGPAAKPRPGGSSPALQDQLPRRAEGFMKRDPASRRRVGRPRPAAQEEPGVVPEAGERVPLSELRPEERRRYSLWGGLSTPLELPPDRIREVSADQAGELGRRDYDTHILGAGPAVGRAPTDLGGGPRPNDSGRRHSLADGLGHASAPATPGAGAEEAAPRLFVSLDIKPEAANPGAPGGLKDAVAELSRISGFQADWRFGPRGRRVWGWIPVRRLGELLESNVVERVETGAGRGRPGAAPSPLTSVLLGVRIRPDGPERGYAFARLSRELEAAAGFRSKQVMGYQAVPRSRDLALIVLGEVPLRNLSRLMAHREVLKLAPAPAPASRGPGVEEARPSRLARFLAFVAGRSPLLLILTLLVLLPPLGGFLAWLVKTFVPYH